MFGRLTATVKKASDKNSVATARSNSHHINEHVFDGKQARPRVAIGGNLDPVADILRGTPDSIRAKLERSYQEAGNPFIVNAGCEIPSATPAANLQALCEPLAYTL